LANKELRQWRKIAHAMFDPLWSETKDRNELYLKLAKALGIHRRDCHFAMFDLERCKAAIKVMVDWLED